MKTQLFIAAAGATFLATYFLFRNKYINRNKYLQVKSDRRPKHHLTQAFANAKKHAMS